MSAHTVGVSLSSTISDVVLTETVIFCREIVGRIQRVDLCRASWIAVSADKRRPFHNCIIQHKILLRHCLLGCPTYVSADLYFTAILLLFSPSNLRATVEQCLSPQVRPVPWSCSACVYATLILSSWWWYHSSLRQCAMDLSGLQVGPGFKSLSSQIIVLVFWDYFPVQARGTIFESFFLFLCFSSLCTS